MVGKLICSLIIRIIIKRFIAIEVSIRLIKYGKLT